MKFKADINDDGWMEDADAPLHVQFQNADHKYETLTPEAFLARARNADIILENCRRSMRGL